MNDDLRFRGREARHARLADLLDRHELDAVLLRRPANFAWFTGGADSRVDRSVRDGVADLVVTRDSASVLTTTIEAARMREEQVPDLPVLARPWHATDTEYIRELTGDGPIGADVPIERAVYVEGEIARHRRVLDADAVERLRSIGADAASALDEAAEAVVPGVDELELAGVLAEACRRRGLTAPVLLAAADQRIDRYRHALPFGATVQRRAMLVISAERGGLFANSTLFVELEEPSPELAQRKRACDHILERMREEATRPGRALSEALADCRRFYAEAGHPDEWRLHHQGGITGYGSREAIATPTSLDPIESGQAFAWNPSITGAKAEETFVLTEAGPEVVTRVPVATA
jgi:Xaa-Pro dipeptidase